MSHAPRQTSRDLAEVSTALRRARPARFAACARHGAVRAAGRVLALSLLGLVSWAAFTENIGVGPASQDAEASGSAEASGLPGARPAPVFVRGDVVLRGFFRPFADTFHPSKQNLVPGSPPWIPVPAESDAHPPSTTLPEEAWVDPAVVRDSLRGGEAADEHGITSRDVLTAVIAIAPTGALSVRWEGAAEGKQALRAGRHTKQVMARFHAVEAASDDPTEVMMSGLPPARPGSLVIEYTDYLDQFVAQQLTIQVEGEGVVLVEQLEDGGWILRPGRAARPEPPPAAER